MVHGFRGSGISTNFGIQVLVLYKQLQGQKEQSLGFGVRGFG